MVSSNKSINVSKRNSRESEVLNIDKIRIDTVSGNPGSIPL